MQSPRRATPPLRRARSASRRPLLRRSTWSRMGRRRRNRPTRPLRLAPTGESLSPGSLRVRSRRRRRSPQPSHASRLRRAPVRLRRGTRRHGLRMRRSRSSGQFPIVVYSRGRTLPCLQRSSPAQCRRTSCRAPRRSWRWRGRSRKGPRGSSARARSRLTAPRSRSVHSEPGTVSCLFFSFLFWYWRRSYSKGFGHSPHLFKLSNLASISSLV